MGLEAWTWDNAGCVYFVSWDALEAPIKVGYTGSDPTRRLADLQVGNPYELKLLGWFEGPPLLEAYLHHMLSKLRMQGEWFKYAYPMHSLVSLSVNDHLHFSEGFGKFTFDAFYEAEKEGFEPSLTGSESSKGEADNK